MCQCLLYKFEEKLSKTALLFLFRCPAYSVLLLFATALPGTTKGDSQTASAGLGDTEKIIVIVVVCCGGCAIIIIIAVVVFIRKRRARANKSKVPILICIMV
jgi:hypothetical protein